jgi:hypothetical protein
MTTFPGSPRLLKGGLVLVDPVTAAVQRIIALQYNPDTLTRTLQVQAVGQAGGDRSEALRLKAPPVETIKLEAEVDVTDQLEQPDQGQNRTAAQLGLHPQLAAFETILYPPAARLLANNDLAKAGTLEIAPVMAPLTLFVWNAVRVLPVRITEISVTEEAFDPNLNPIRARISLAMQVLSVNDLGFDVKGGDLYLAYQKGKERLAAQSPAGSFAALGIGGIS